MKTSQLFSWPLNPGCQFDNLWPFAKNFWHFPWLPKGLQLRVVPQFFITIMRPYLKIENHMCLWGFFFQIAENVLIITKRIESVNSPKQLNSFWFSLFCLLEHYSWDSKSEAFTHHRWIHESFRVIFFLVDKWCLKISNRNIEFVCNKLRPLWI